jgi:hypothetical protein
MILLLVFFVKLESSSRYCFLLSAVLARTSANTISSGSAEQISKAPDINHNIQWQIFKQGIRLLGFFLPVITNSLFCSTLLLSGLSVPTTTRDMPHWVTVCFFSFGKPDSFVFIVNSHLPVQVLLDAEP